MCIRDRDRAIARLKTAETLVSFGSVLAGSQAAPAIQAFQNGAAIADAAINKTTDDIQTGIIDANNRLPIPMNLSPNPQSQIDNLNALSNAALDKIQYDHLISDTTAGINQLLADTDQQFNAINTKSAQIAADVKRLADEALANANSLLNSIPRI